MYLNEIVNKLAISSKEAIASGNADLDTLNQYLHVQRTIERDLIEKLECASQASGNQLIILAGNVGDGKSHLLSYLRKKYPELMNQFYIHNDATESFDYSTDALTTLKETIFDKLENGTNQKIILAINLGIIYNFINKFNETEFEKDFIDFIDNSEVFSGYTKKTAKQHDVFSIVSFSDYQLFYMDSDGAKSDFLTTLFAKIVNHTDENPFFIAYQASKNASIDEKLIENYEFFSNQYVRKNIVDLIIQATVKFKLVISMRQIYQFIYECLSPNLDEALSGYFVENFFKRDTQNQVLQSVRTFDPFKSITQEQDLLIIQLLQQGMKPDEIKNQQWSEFLTASTVENPQVKEYLNYLYAHYGPKSAKKPLKHLYSDVKNVLLTWDGKAGIDRMYLDNSSSLFRISQTVKINFSKEFDVIGEETIEYLNLTLPIKFLIDSEVVSLNLDYKLYELVMKLRDGYRPNKVDREKAIHLTDCIDKILQIATKEQEELYFTLEEQGKKYILAIDTFDEFTFSEEV